MAVKLDKKITGYQVKSQDTPSPEMHSVQTLEERDDTLTGATYKFKPPTSDHSIYVTINDKNGRPFEIFINTKCPTYHTWLSTVTRLVSAIFRSNQDCTFVIDELKAIIDPAGGYYYPKMGYITSVQAHIGIILERHINGRK